MTTPLADFLRNLRLSKGFSKTTAAYDMDCTPQTIWSWETGTSAPKDENLRKYVTLLDGDHELAQELYNESRKKPGRPGLEKYYDFLSTRRGELKNFIIASRYYSNIYNNRRDMIDFPLITKSSWIPNKLVDISEVNLILENRKSREKIPEFTKKYPTFSDFKLYRGERLSADQVYRLISIDCENGRMNFTCDSTHYDTSLNNQELIAFETTKWYIDKRRKSPENTGIDLPLRGNSKNIWSLMDRECAWSTNTITIILNHPDLGDHFYIHHRVGERLAEGKNTVSIVPAGTFQPIGHLDWNRDFSLEKNIMREFLEELYGRDEYERMIFSDNGLYGNEKTQEIFEARSTGNIKIYYLGIGFDPLTTKPGLLSAMIIDWNKNRNLLNSGFTANWEGKFETMKFDRENLLKIVRMESALPFGAACCLQAINLYEHLIKS